MKLRNRWNFLILALFVVFVLMLSACQPIGYIVVTATPEQFWTPTTVPPTNTTAPTSTSTPEPTPTQEISEHQRCAIAHVDCYVNENPTLISGTINHTMINGRNVDVPQGYRPKMATSPSPFVYCYTWHRGCQFEFHWIAGAFGYQTEDITLYPDTVYMIKLVYSINAACSQGNNCATDQLSVGSIVFLNDERTILANQPVATRTGTNQEAVWAIRVIGNEPVEAAIQTFLQVQWAVFAEPAKFTIHEIGVIAQPSAFDGFAYPIRSLS